MASLPDRALFGVSRFLWPAHNLVLLVVIGAFHGQDAIADYTYALAICGPLYFLTSFTFALFLLVDSKRGRYRRELLFLRILSVAASLPLVTLAVLLFPSTQTYAVVALWILKLGEVLFEPVPIYIGTHSTAEHRGKRLFLCDASRVLLSQVLMWFCLLVLESDLVALLWVTGLGNLLLSLWFLVSVPKWTSRRLRAHRVLAASRRLFRFCLPMTLSAALLAFLISLPRILMEGVLEEHERAIFGTAQVIGSGAALFFNAMWLYEFQQIRKRVRENDFFGVARINLTLSFFFFVALAAGSLALFFIQPLVFSALRINAAPSGLLPALVFLLGIQHCISVHRDLLKLIGQVWAEVRVLVGALAVATLAHQIFVLVLDGPWLWGVTAFCVLSALVQVALAYLQVRRLSPAHSS